MSRKKRFVTLYYIVSQTEGSKTLLRKRWAQVRKQDHPPVCKMKAIDVYKYMYFVADKLDFDWSTVLTSGEKARVGRKC